MSILNFNLAVTATLLLFTSILSAQSESLPSEYDSGWRIGADMNANYPLVESFDWRFPVDEYETWVIQDSGTRMIQLGLHATHVGERGWFSEYSLVSLGFGKDEDVIISEIPAQGIMYPSSGNEKYDVEIRLRYEYGKLFPVTSNGKVMLGFSIAFDPFFDYFKMIPLTSLDSGLKAYQIGVDMNVNPRVDIRLAKKLHMSIQFPLSINRHTFERAELNYRWPDSTVQKSWESTFGITRLQASMGISYRITD